MIPTPVPTGNEALLAEAPLFAALPPGVRGELAALLREERYPAGTEVVRQGEVGDRIFLVLQGRAEAAVAGGAGPVPVETLEAGEWFGKEIALLDPAARRHATVTALTDLRLLSLADADFERVLAAHPEAREAAARGAEDALEAWFLKWASPFQALGEDRLRRLAGRTENLAVPAGAVIVREGEAGDTCYLVRSGRVEVLDGEGRVVSTLGPGSIFGETALLTEAPAHATKRAAEPCELLALHRAELLEAMGSDPRVGAGILETARMRDRPRRVEGVEAHHRQTGDGETVTVLKDPARGAYYRLSAEGWFLWERLDGKSSFRDLVMAYFREFRAFAPGVVAEVVGGLAAAGLVELRALRKDVQEAIFRPTPAQRLLLAARGALEWQAVLRNVDAPLTRLYGRLRWLYSRPAQVALGLLAAGGLAAFLLATPRASEALRDVSGLHLLLFLVPAQLGGVLLHELGHALTAKAFGREVHRVGVGWYWFGPAAFVDTSDMWLSGRGARIAVTLAGPYANLVLAGVAGLAALFSTQAMLAAAAWEFALVSYLFVLVNLNPLLELDGYYVLMDWLERPNLRARCMGWLGEKAAAALRGTLPTREELRRHGFELAYGTASVLYVAVAAALTLAVYRLALESWVHRLLPAPAAAASAWVLCAAVVALCLAGVAGDLRGGALRPAKR